MIRTPPAEVARKLRQEAGFGCAVCGNPILEYHHIIEWKEKQHFDLEHMVALCPTHHHEYGKLPRHKAYSAKANPINIKNKRIKGYLGSQKPATKLFLGNVQFYACRNAISYCGVPIANYRHFDGQIEVGFFFPDKDFWPEIEIKSGNLVSQIENFWDIEFKTNWLKFRRKEGENFLTLDLRNSDARITGYLEIGNDKIFMTPNRLEINNCKFELPLIAGGGHSAISIGPPGKLIRPNYAMKSPEAIYYENR